MNGIENRKPMPKGVWLLFSFKGRINRKIYWIYNAVIFASGIMLGMFTEITSDLYEISRPQIMFMLWVLWPSMAVQAKRWHDRDKSALWLLINFIPIAGPLYALYENGFLPGTSGPNRFGPEFEEAITNE